MRGNFLANRKKDDGIYYLLPGMGKHNAARKRRMMLKWSLAVGLAVSALLAGLLYFLAKS